jgi:chemotaxis protein methyltransferase CheR
LNPPCDRLTFQSINRQIRELTGVVYAEDRMDFVLSRLAPVLEQFQLRDWASLSQQASHNSSLRQALISQVTTHETSFFRDQTCWDLLRFFLIPELMGTRKEFRIWCAASSTGQEIYSLAIALAEMIPHLKDYKIQIVGTDIDQQCISKASYGLYSELECSRGLNAHFLSKYFVAQGKDWRIRDELRGMVSFRPLNLLDPYPWMGHFDLILCRNVLIYFDIPTRKSIVERMKKTLKQPGALVLGTQELLYGVTECLTRKDFRGSIFYGNDN